MSRLMSVGLTTVAVVRREKTVTRRLGWKFLKKGDRLTLCKKVQGRKPGEPLIRLAEVEVVSVRRELLLAMTDEDVLREGVPPECFDEIDLTGPNAGHPCANEWVRWFSETMDLDPREHYEQMVTRIEWRYLP